VTATATTPRVRRGQVLRAALSLVIAGSLLAFAVPKVTGADWGASLDLIRTLRLWQIGALVGLWLTGLVAYTFVATGALPSLTHRQALTLNLTGSAVSNLVPFGGALGMGLNYRMIRSWGHDRASFAPFTALTSLLNILTKLSLPVFAWALLLARGGLVPANLRPAVYAALGFIAVVVGGVALLLCSPRALGASAGALNRLVSRVLRALRVEGRFDLDHHVLEARHRTVALLRVHGTRMIAWMLVYGLLQAALLYAILESLGSSLGMVQVFAGFAFGRLLSLLVVTPGGVGISETGSASLLIALGGDPAIVLAGTLLYSALTFFLEIPVGGLCGLMWWRRAASRTRETA
jgi:uncharacterized membrane protein YbhN (UPF0104 family)